MTKRLKDTPGLSNYVKKSDSFKTDKLIKVFDTKTNKNIFKKQSEVIDDNERYQPIDTVIKMLKKDNEKKLERIKIDNFGLREEKRAMGGRIGYKSGTRGCKLAMKGKGKAYGKNS